MNQWLSVVYTRFYKLDIFVLGLYLGLTPAERQREHDQVTALGYSGHNTETQERLEMQHVVSPEEGVDDDPYEEDPRVDKAHSRMADLTDYLWSIPGFEAY